jgi:subtilisin family serine protease
MPGWARGAARRIFGFKGIIVFFKRMAFRCLPVLMVVTCLHGGPAWGHDRRALGFQRLQQQARQGSVRVLVQLDVAELATLTTTSVTRRQPQAAAAADRRLEDAISRQARQVLTALGATAHRVHRTYRTVPLLALGVSQNALQALEALPAVLGVHEDLLLRPTLDGTVPLVGAPGAWGDGWDGSGWWVAILDTGVLASHDFFAGKEIRQACFASGADGDPGTGGDCPNGTAEDLASADAARHHPSNFNFFDHGTQVAGPAVGRDPDPGQVPRHGVAPGAGLIAVQVYSRFDDHPFCGVANDCVLSYTSDQIAGLEYVFGLRATLRIAAVNVSIGSGRFFDQSNCDAAFAGFEAVVSNLRHAGIATILATGNNGYCDSLNGPACISSGIAVGATDDADVEASFSNFHPGMTELFAPGVAILTSAGSGDGDYVSRGGTSLAAPHVAGAWAVLKHAFPSASVEDVLAALQSTGETAVTYRCGGPGPARIRIHAALQELSAPVPTLSTWGTLVLAALLLLVGARLLRRQGHA